MANELMSHLGKVVRMVGYYVDRKYLHTKHRQPMSFAAWLDAEGAFFDTVHFPQSLDKYPLQGIGRYLIKEKVVEEFGHTSVEVEKVAKLPVT